LLITTDLFVTQDSELLCFGCLIDFQRTRETPATDSRSAEAKVGQEMALVVHQSVSLLENSSSQVDDDAFKPMVRTSVEPSIVLTLLDFQAPLLYRAII
jgi:hypothetical protein